MKPPAESAANRAHIHRARRLLVAGTLAISAVLAYGGPLRAGAPLHALPRIPFGGADTADDLRIRLSGVKTAFATSA